jgi:hypothetical protein
MHRKTKIVPKCSGKKLPLDLWKVFTIQDLDVGRRRVVSVYTGGGTLAEAREMYLKTPRPGHGQNFAEWNVKHENMPHRTKNRHTAAISVSK